MLEVDKGWWRDERGYIRQVTLYDDDAKFNKVPHGTTMYVAWLHFKRPFGYFKSWNSALEKINEFES
jgi:hypothetical protein